MSAAITTLLISTGIGFILRGLLDRRLAKRSKP